MNPFSHSHSSDFLVLDATTAYTDDERQVEWLIMTTSVEALLHDVSLPGSPSWQATASNLERNIYCVMRSAG